jgi:hypothetical protein
MSRIVDNLVAYKILSMLVTNFEDTKAYKLNIIDKNGKNLKKASTLKTSEEKDAYTYLTRLVFNMKKIINRLPGGESKLKSVIAALFLIKEYHESKDRSTSLMEERYLALLEKLEKNNVVLVEEEIFTKKFFEGTLTEDGVVTTGPANVTGAAVSTDEPVIRKKNIKKYQKMSRRAVPLTVGTTNVAS